MKIAVTGSGVLADTTRDCCGRGDAGMPGPHDVVSVSDRDIEVLWVCHDTPISGDGTADVEQVINWIQKDLTQLKGRPVILISSQLPVLTTFRLKERFPGHFFAYSPENIRVAHAVPDFLRQARVLVGVPSHERDSVLLALFRPFTGRVIFTTLETAEMVKHALNAYLGMSIAFINEIARVCADVKADAAVVSDALLSERRISPNAPLRPGKPFGGGHLMRDILILEERAKGRGLNIPIISHIRESNEAAG